MTRAVVNGRVVADGLSFPEEPRWHDGRLWCIDTTTRTLNVMEPERADVVERIEAGFAIGGFGWLPDSTLVAVDGDTHSVRSFDATNGWRPWADLTDHTVVRPNGLTVDGTGLVYVAMLGSELTHDDRTAPRPSGTIVMIDEHRMPRTVWSHDLLFPNGIAVRNGALVIPETFGSRLTRLTVGSNGLPTSALQMAIDSRAHPDGCCILRNGNVWVADASGRRCLLLDADGTVIDTVHTEQHCYACATDDAEHHLYLCVAPGHDPANRERLQGRVLELPLDDDGRICDGSVR